MQFGINAHLLSLDSTYRAAGVSNYIYYLLQNLSRMDASNRYRIFTGSWGRQPGVREQLALGDNFEVRGSSFPTTYPPLRLLWEQTAQIQGMFDLDAHLSPVNVVPILTRVPRVVTIHDLAFLRFRNKHLPAKRNYLSLMTRLSAQRARYVLADSESTRNDVMQLLGVPAEKVLTVPLGVDEEFRWLGNTTKGQCEIEAFRLKHGLPERFFLYLGTLEPRKNIPLLIKGYAAMRQQGMGHHAEQITPPKLVLAGPKGWMYEEIFALVQELGLENDVLFPGFIAREDIVWWYNAALGFIYLSAYEGFGLPPLQAMACGVPTIVHNASSLPEVVGKAGLLVEAEDCNSVADAMRQIANAPDLRADLRFKGLEQAQKFTWKHTAEKTLMALEQAGQKQG